MTPPRTAFLFPGQGSQSVGMLSDLADAFPIVHDTFEEAGTLLGRDLWALAQQGPKADLDRTENTQPAMLAAGVAVWRCWRQQWSSCCGRRSGRTVAQPAELSVLYLTI